jgi:hypothetical protein
MIQIPEYFSIPLNNNHSMGTKYRDIQSHLSLTAHNEICHKLILPSETSVRAKNKVSREDFLERNWARSNGSKIGRKNSKVSWLPYESISKDEGVI